MCISMRKFLRGCLDPCWGFSCLWFVYTDIQCLSVQLRSTNGTTDCRQWKVYSINSFSSPEKNTPIAHLWGAAPGQASACVCVCSDWGNLSSIGSYPRLQSYSSYCETVVRSDDWAGLLSPCLSSSWRLRVLVPRSRAFCYPPY